MGGAQRVHWIWHGAYVYYDAGALMAHCGRERSQIIGTRGEIFGQSILTMVPLTEMVREHALDLMVVGHVQSLNGV